jgi:two-component system OmpR family response regulator
VAQAADIGQKWARTLRRQRGRMSGTADTRALGAMGGSHMLVVDDDAQIRQLATRFLRDHGFRVTPARDGREMWQALDSGSVDLVVLDLMMPGTNGLDLCRNLRRTSAVPVVMLTAKGDDIDRIIGLEVGADDYLPKPFNPRELLARINAVLRRSRTASPSMDRTGRGFAFDGWRLDTLNVGSSPTRPVRRRRPLDRGIRPACWPSSRPPSGSCRATSSSMDGAKHRTAEAFDRAIDVQVSRLRRRSSAAPTRRRR